MAVLKDLTVLGSSRCIGPVYGSIFYEGGTSLAAKYAAIDHTHSGYAASTHTHTVSDITDYTAGVTSLTVASGPFSAPGSTTGAISFSVPTAVSHLTNDLGFLTAHQTIKSDRLEGAESSHYGSCSTPVATANKSITVVGKPSLTSGLRVIAKFTNDSTAASPKLIVTDGSNPTSAKSIKYRGDLITSTNNNILKADRVYEFVYDGSAWQVVGDLLPDVWDCGTW